eukprot:7606692-Pyramimonas_sp.AAC.1
MFRPNHLRGVAPVPKGLQGRVLGCKLERQSVRFAVFALYFPPCTRDKDQLLKCTNCCERMIRWLTQQLDALAG